MKTKSKLTVLILGITVMELALATSWTELRQSISGECIIYSGELGDLLSPQPGREKIAIKISGRAAKDIFNSIGPDDTHTCGAGNGVRIREKDSGALSCIRSAKGEYSCHVGFDLKTGKSIGGIIC